LLDRVPPAVRALPRIAAVTPISVGPFFGPQVFNASWEIAGQPFSSSPDLNPRVPIEAGGPEYFRTFGIPLLRGRGFLESDRANTSGVAVLSEAAARLLFQGQNPIGQQIRFSGDTSADNVWRTVVGIAGDIRYRVLREATPTVYLPSRQYFFQGSIAVRTVGALADVLPALRRAVQEAYPSATIVRVETMDELLTDQLSQPKMNAFLLSAFGLLALLLAAVGLYGLMAFAVSARTHELGVRAALGATPWRLRRDVLRWAILIGGVGTLVGVAGALAVSRLLTSLLFGVSPGDPVALVGVGGLLLAVVLVAADVPARRATRIDPATALRTE
jgi:putative ABC transport system permease protein